MPKKTGYRGLKEFLGVSEVSGINESSITKYKLISWNINGIKAAIKNGLVTFIQKEDPEICCLQEIKSHYTEFNAEVPNYLPYWNPAKRKGYAGTAIFSKINPQRCFYGMDIPGYDDEGRVTTLEFNRFFLVNVYTVNAQRGLKRLSYRQEWDKVFLAYIRKLNQTKPVIFCGDLNVAHMDIDIARPKENRRNAGFTDEERAGFSNILAAGFVDSFRIFNNEPGNYTWWSYMTNARAKNIGWRIDYFVVSERIKSNVKISCICKEVLGSDHCPIMLEIEF